MAKETLLSIVQQTQTVIGDAPVNSIGDTPEAEDMALLAKMVFDEISTWDEWPDEEAVSSLESVSDSANAPTVLHINDDYRYIQKVQYLIKEPDRQYFKDLDYYIPMRFMDATDYYLSDNNHVKTTGYGIEQSFIPVLSDKDPSFYTSFDNKHIILNSFDYSKESNVQETNCRVFVIKDPVFEIRDDFILDYIPSLLNLYKAELKIAASYYFNQQNNPKDRRSSLRSLNKLRVYKDKVSNEQKENWPNGQYGRRGLPPNISKFGRR